MSEGLELSGYVHLSVEFGAIAIFVGWSKPFQSFMGKNWYLYKWIRYFALVLAIFFFLVSWIFALSYLVVYDKCTQWLSLKQHQEKDFMQTSKNKEEVII